MAEYSNRLERVFIITAAAFLALEIHPAITYLLQPTACTLSPLLEIMPFIYSACLAGLCIGAISLFIPYLTKWLIIFMPISLFTLLIGDQRLYSNHLVLFTIISIFLCLRFYSPANRALYTRSLCVQICLLYFLTALAKTNGFFLSGSYIALYVSSSNIVALPENLQTQPIFSALAFLAVAFEYSLGFLLAIKRYRKLGLLLAICFHAMLTLTGPPFALDGIIVFSLLMFSSFVVIDQIEPVVTATRDNLQ